jgi:hypothetical protein
LQSLLGGFEIPICRLFLPADGCPQPVSPHIQRADGLYCKAFYSCMVNVDKKN